MNANAEPAPYEPVPVHAAADIGARYGKAIVIVCAWDSVYGMLHTTTWGLLPQDKHHAARGGELAAAALGADLARTKAYEDFRKDDLTGERARILDEARKLLARMDDAELGENFEADFSWHEFEPLRQAFKAYDAKAASAPNPQPETGDSKP